MPPERESSIVDIEEYDKALAAPPAPPKASEFKLDGDDVPEEFRGKTAAEVAAMAKAGMAALRTSEEARATMKSVLEARKDEPPPKPAEPAPEPEMTREQLKALYDEDPLAAMEKMTEIAEKRATKNLQTRLGNIEVSGASMAENWARQEFPDEFKLFENDLKAFVKRFPPATFSTKQGWEDAVSYVRGQRGNFEKLVKYRSEGPDRTASEAREEQEKVAGHIGTGAQPRSKIPAEGPVVLDATQKEIAREFINSGVFKDEAEYIKWSRIGAAS